MIPRIPGLLRSTEQAPIAQPSVEQSRAREAVAAQTTSAPVSIVLAQSPANAVTGSVPPPEARAIDLDEGAQIASIKRGEDLLKTGNIAQARLAFLFAANAGNPTAALRLGDTFDPLRLAELGTVGTVGDLNQAIHWYGVADELGSAMAKSRLLDVAPRVKVP